MRTMSYSLFKIPIEGFISPIFTGIVLKVCWGLDGIVPAQYLQGTEFDVALRMLVLIAFPLYLMVISIMVYRLST